MSKAVAELRHWGFQELQSLVEDPRLPHLTAGAARIEIDTLLQHSLVWTKAQLLSRLSDSVAEEECQRFEGLVRRRSQMEPIAYILGQKEFFSLDFEVSPDVLIPRPETELLVERGLEILFSEDHLREFGLNDKPLTVVDLCTGSAAIITSIASKIRENKGASVLNDFCFYGLDLCESALDVARRNARKHELSEQISFHQGDLLHVNEELRSLSHALILCNPPYVSSEEVLSPDVDKFEPKMALRAGVDGLDIIRRLFRQLSEEGPETFCLLMEIGHEQGHAVKSLVSEIFKGPCVIHQDLRGLPRMLEVGVRTSK